MKLDIRKTGAAAVLAMAMSVPAMAQDRASLETIHVKAVQANTAAQHAAVARDYRLQAEGFSAKASTHEKEAAQLMRTAGAMAHKWPGMVTGQVQKVKAKAVEARRAERESMALADRHIRLAVETQAESPLVAAE